MDDIALGVSGDIRTIFTLPTVAHGDGACAVSQWDNRGFSVGLSVVNTAGCEVRVA